jgi:hypothetical protein
MHFASQPNKEVESLWPATTLSSYAGLPGQLIRVRAVDDFGVVDVAIVVSALDGEVLEQGNASPAENSTVWVAQPVVANLTLSNPRNAPAVCGKGGGKVCLFDFLDTLSNPSLPTPRLFW